MSEIKRLTSALLTRSVSTNASSVRRQTHAFLRGTPAPRSGVAEFLLLAKSDALWHSGTLSLTGCAEIPAQIKDLMVQPAAAKMT